MGKFCKGRMLNATKSETASIIMNSQYDMRVDTSFVSWTFVASPGSVRVIKV